MVRTPRPVWVMIALAACDGGVGPDVGGLPASVAIVAPPDDLFESETRQLAVRVIDAAGQVVDTTVTWATSDAGVATVSGAGVARGIAPGEADLVASLGDLRDTAHVTVLERMGFRFPVVGQPNVDLYLHNYVDLMPESEIGDYWCGRKSYDGHQGTDVSIANFAVMDSGVSVVAVAAGTVMTVTDGAFDRNTVWQGGGLGNYVAIAHRDGFVTYYGHMVNGSPAVAVGEVVAPGALLGLVGSSGNSDLPHLHFEVRRHGAVVDPYTGACGATFTHWDAPLAYQDTFLLIASGITDETLSLDAVKNPPAQVTVYQQTDAALYMWVQLFNLRAGSQSRWEVRAPDGSLWDDVVRAHNDAYSMSWWWLRYNIAGVLFDPGAWVVRYYHDDQLLAEQPFTLEDVAPAQASAFMGPRATVSGGPAYADPVRRR